MIVLDADIDAILFLRSGNVSITKSRNSNKAPTSFCSSCKRSTMNTQLAKHIYGIAHNRFFHFFEAKSNEQKYTLFTCVGYVIKYAVIVNFRNTIFNSSQRLTDKMNFNAKNIASMEITWIIYVIRPNQWQIAYLSTDFPNWSLLWAVQSKMKTRKWSLNCTRVHCVVHTNSTPHRWRSLSQLKSQTCFLLCPPWKMFSAN